MIRHAYGDPERLPDRIALRRRHIEGLSLDPKQLRKGTNVVAIELHRAPYHEVATQKARNGTLVPWGGRSYRPEHDTWSTVGMTRFTLTASGQGLFSNRTRPKGLQVWTADPVMPVYDTDFGDVGAAPLPVSPPDQSTLLGVRRWSIKYCLILSTYIQYASPVPVTPYLLRIVLWEEFIWDFT